MLYDKIKTRCKEQGIPVYKLESSLGLASSSISKWNKSDPTARNLLAVAQALGTSVEELLKE